MQHNDSQPSDRSGVLFEDLVEGMVWPKLLRAGGLALRPERIGLGVVIVVLVGLIQQIGSLWHDEESVIPFEGLATAVSGEITGAATLGGAALLGGGGFINSVLTFIVTLVDLPMEMVSRYPFSMVVLGVPMLLVWGVVGGAISRSVMSEISLARVPGWPEALGGAVRRWVSLLGALLVPLGLVAGCWYLTAVFGLGMHVAVVNVITAALFGIGIVLGVLATLVLIAYAIGGWMLVPAVMAEGTDALDGVQRSLAYVWSRPLRAVVYLVILTTVGVIAVRLAGWISDESVEFATNAARDWGPTSDTGAWGGNPAGTASAAAEVIGFWGTLMSVLIAGYAVSYIHTAGALQYLCLRRVCDGQEIGELWEE